MLIIRAYLLKKMGEVSYLEKEGTKEIMVQVRHTLVSLDINHYEKRKLSKFGAITQLWVYEE